MRRRAQPIASTDVVVAVILSSDFLYFSSTAPAVPIHSSLWCNPFVHPPSFPDVPNVRFDLTRTTRYSSASDIVVSDVIPVSTRQRTNTSTIQHSANCGLQWLYYSFTVPDSSHPSRSLSMSATSLQNIHLFQRLRLFISCHVIRYNAHGHWMVHVCTIFSFTPLGIRISQ